MLRVVNSFVVVLYVLASIFVSQPVHAETPTPKLIFTEIKVRFDTTNPLDNDEFIELYNASSDPVQLSDYGLEYFNVTNPPDSQQPVQKPISTELLAAGQYLVLAKQPLQITNSKQSPFSSLADTGGRLRLVTSEGTIVDEIAWTNVSANATAVGVYPSVIFQCNSSTILCNSNRVQSISRSKDIDGNQVLVNPKWQLATPTPQSSELLPAPVITDPQTDTSTDPPVETSQIPPEPAVTCEGVVINEILPNPGGADTGKEYIELYNPTNEVISLAGCSLQIAGNNTSFLFGQAEMQPGQYLAFYDGQTGLTLPNSAGGKIWLLSPTEELQAIIYPGGLDDDASWALIDGVWQITYKPTPAALNTALPLKPCATSQVRNTDTGRCQSLVTASLSSLTPCKTGQERNPDTGRCRTIATTVASLTPCKEGQERNPETNRCRSTTATSELEPCPSGQERNSDTNRCRKVTVSNGNTLAAVTDVKSNVNTHNPKWWLAGIAILFAIGYAAFEWRQDVVQYFLKLKTKFIR